MSIGYACLNIGTPDTNIRSVMQRNATPEKLTEVTTHNLAALEKMIDYNRRTISSCSISSDLILFGSSSMRSLVGTATPKPDIERRSEEQHAEITHPLIHRPIARRVCRARYRSHVPQNAGYLGVDNQHKSSCWRYLWG